MNLTKQIYLFIFIILVIIFFSAYFLTSPDKTKEKIVGNQEILKEIDSLLPLLEAKNITGSDFNKIESITLDDSYAGDEIIELNALAEDKEYSHIGHGLGFLYNYVKTGIKQICPGHSLAHYYVFTKHNRTELAMNNLEDAKNSFFNWSDKIVSKPKINLTEVSEFKDNFNESISQISSGNSSASEEEISYFSDETCV